MMIKSSVENHEGHVQFDRVEMMGESGPAENPYYSTMQSYYKAGYRGVNAQDVEWFPTNFRMIAGNPASTGPQPGVVWYDCIRSGNTQDLYQYDQDSDGTLEDSEYVQRRSSIPTDCPATVLEDRPWMPGYGTQMPVYVDLNVEFPQCGQRDASGNIVLTSANGRDHVAYGLGWPDLGCPASHPVEFPQLTVHWRYKVPAGGSDDMVLASDMYLLNDANQPAGYSGHSDFFNGWHPYISGNIINNCFKDGPDADTWGLDCRMGRVAPNPAGGWYTLGLPE
jgi:hypothetical protein